MLYFPYRTSYLVLSCGYNQSRVVLVMTSRHRTECRYSYHHHPATHSMSGIQSIYVHGLKTTGTSPACLCANRPRMSVRPCAHRLSLPACPYAHRPSLPVRSCAHRNNSPVLTPTVPVCQLCSPSVPAPSASVRAKNDIHQKVNRLNDLFTLQDD